MPRKAQEWGAPKFFLNGVQVDKIPEDAIAIMSERVGRVVSQYFQKHPDEYERFLEGMEQQKQEALT